jgi:hypothetical protein
VNRAGLAVGRVTLEAIRRVARRRPDPGGHNHAADRESMARGSSSHEHTH